MSFLTELREALHHLAMVRAHFTEKRLHQLRLEVFYRRIRRLNPTELPWLPLERVDELTPREIPVLKPLRWPGRRS